MNTIATSNSRPHRKLIDIPEDVFRALTIKAATTGMNLKKYIENLLVEDANEIDDDEIYKYLIATRPEGKQMLNQVEKLEFENWMQSHRQ